MAVLLLNADYRPLRIVSEEKAVGLMFRDTVEAATQTVKTLRSPSTTFDVPIVLRLKRYVNVPRRKAKWSRRGVLKRDRYTCGYCGATGVTMTIDHIKPLSRGGVSGWGNTVCACLKCNQRKADHLPHEVGMRLRWEPKTPRTNYVVASGNVPQEWRIYFES